MRSRSIRSTLLACGLLLGCCAQAPEDQGQDKADSAREVTLQSSEAPLAAQAAALPEVRYYLIADT